MIKTAAKILLGLGITIVLCIAVLFYRYQQLSLKQYQPPAIDLSQETPSANLELGKRIYSIRNGCIECHGADLSGAMVMDNPAMGSIWGANITPHLLKDWTDEEIAKSIRFGVHKSGRSLQFMPSFDFVALSKGDLASLVAYIRSVPPVEKNSHENVFGPMAKILSSLGKMPVMFPALVIDMNKDFDAKPEEGPTKEFGAYLAKTCVGCHNENLSGGPIPGGDPAWPPAANIRLGANAVWTEESFTEAIKSGVSASTKNKLRPPMPIALLQQLTETEVKALWLYLSTLK